jgi:hemerythrin-like domain-containing protein
MWGLSPFLIEHYELERMAKGIQETIGTLDRAEEKDEPMVRLIRMLSVKIQLLSQFLSHHLEMEEKVLFQMVLEVMNTSELFYAYGMMKVLESWPPSFLKR